MNQPERERSDRCQANGRPGHGSASSAVGWRMILFVAGLAAMTSPAQAHEPRDVEAGIECSTQVQPQEIAPNHFVLNRTTYCRPSADAVLTAAFEAISRTEVREADGFGHSVAPDSSQKVETPPRAEQLPTWSSNRRRFANAQYASSLSELRGAIRRVTR